MGGSITCGGNTRVLEEQWSYRVFLWVNATFPHANHTYLNSCKPATPSMVIGACLTVPDHVDLILMEVALFSHLMQQALLLAALPCIMQYAEQCTQ